MMWVYLGREFSISHQASAEGCRYTLKALSTAARFIAFVLPAFSGFSMMNAPLASMFCRVISCRSLYFASLKFPMRPWHSGTSEASSQVAGEIAGNDRLRRFQQVHGEKSDPPFANPAKGRPPFVFSICPEIRFSAPPALVYPPLTSTILKE
jgi:hypothetical protein